MLKNCIFHEPVIHCDRHSVGIVSDIEFLHTILFTLCAPFLIVLEKSYIFSNLRHFFYFGWLFTALQFSKCTKYLYKMNNNSIYGFLTN